MTTGSAHKGSHYWTDFYWQWWGGSSGHGDLQLLLLLLVTMTVAVVVAHKGIIFYTVRSLNRPGKQRLHSVREIKEVGAFTGLEIGRDVKENCREWEEERESRDLYVCEKDRQMIWTGKKQKKHRQKDRRRRSDIEQKTEKGPVGMDPGAGCFNTGFPSISRKSITTLHSYSSSLSIHCCIIYIMVQLRCRWTHTQTCLAILCSSAWAALHSTHTHHRQGGSLHTTQITNYHIISLKRWVQPELVLMLPCKIRQCRILPPFTFQLWI